MTYADPVGEARRWWGRFELEVGRGGRWRLGPLDLRILRRPAEWRVAWKATRDRMDASYALERDLEALEIPEGYEVRRFATRGGRVLGVLPVLPDRAVVVRPEHPLFVLEGQRVDLFMSIPIWLRLIPGAEGPPMLDVPSFRLSDTWFGPSTRSGELGYASKTSARTSHEDVPRDLVHRAIAKVSLVNKADTVMPVERLSLPVAHLSLWSDAEHGLWVNPVTVERDRSGDVARVELSSEPPSECGAAELVAGPRSPESGNVFQRALDGLIGFGR